MSLQDTDSATTYTCAICQQQLPSEDNLKYHLHSHQINDFAREVRGGFVCRLCSDFHVFYKYPSFTRHVRFEHLEKINRVSCDNCGMIFTTISGLNQHIRSHFGIHRKLFSCLLCYSVFLLKGQIIKHMRIVHRVQHNCIVCNKTFVTHEELRKHSLHYHTAYSTFTCYICGLQFLLYGRFKEHMYRHLHKKIHMCFGCFETFNDFEVLKQHKTSEQTKPKCKKWMVDKEVADLQTKVGQFSRYKCSICNRPGLDNNTLKIHMIRHLCCDVCHELFPSREVLREHLTTVHSLREISGKTISQKQKPIQCRYDLRTRVNGKFVKSAEQEKCRPKVNGAKTNQLIGKCKKNICLINTKRRKKSNCIVLSAISKVNSEKSKALYNKPNSKPVTSLVYKCGIRSCGLFYSQRDYLAQHTKTKHSDVTMECLYVEHNYSKAPKG